MWPYIKSTKYFDVVNLITISQLDEATTLEAHRDSVHIGLGYGCSTHRVDCLNYDMPASERSLHAVIAEILADSQNVTTGCSCVCVLMSARSCVVQTICTVSNAVLHSIA